MLEVYQTLGPINSKVLVWPQSVAGHLLRFAWLLRSSKSRRPIALFTALSLSIMFILQLKSFRFDRKTAKLWTNYSCNFALGWHDAALSALLPYIQVNSLRRAHQDF